MDIYDRIEKLLQENKMSAYKLSKITGISTGLLSQWKGRSQNPSADKLQKVADCFGVSVDYLLTGEESTQKERPATKSDEPEITFDDFTYAFLDESKELTEENKQKLLEMAKFFKQQQEKDN
ncbi:helix-turn-helix domain-containing protein [Scatolibacter rhodanostii]|uniref:helix-turn-helix domain-containing protein n=1 Tax=Scatolibacter rhodanostii TaxID=2014781 RepID=UPI000C086C21|nr:helix-turn-helix transcriptional regulator [Scatolibacter rhodanostii]